MMNKKVDNLMERLERSKPCKMTITLKSGETITTSPGDAIRLFQNCELSDSIAGVTADRSEYAALAELLAGLCNWS